MNATDSGLSEPVGFETVVVCILVLTFLSGFVTGGCTVWLCGSKPRKGAGLDRDEFCSCCSHRCSRPTLTMTLQPM